MLTWAILLRVQKCCPFILCGAGDRPYPTGSSWAFLQGTAVFGECAEDSAALLAEGVVWGGGQGCETGRNAHSKNLLFSHHANCSQCDSPNPTLSFGIRSQKRFIKGY